jgi:hypothetical protein
MDLRTPPKSWAESSFRRIASNCARTSWRSGSVQREHISGQRPAAEISRLRAAITDQGSALMSPMTCVRRMSCAQ